MSTPSSSLPQEPLRPRRSSRNQEKITFGDHQWDGDDFAEDDIAVTTPPTQDTRPKGLSEVNKKGTYGLGNDGDKVHVPPTSSKLIQPKIEYSDREE